MESKIELKLVKIKDKGKQSFIDEERNKLVFLREADFYYESPQGAVKVKFSFVGKTDKDIEKLRERKVYLVFENGENKAQGNNG